MFNQDLVDFLKGCGVCQICQLRYLKARGNEYQNLKESFQNVSRINEIVKKFIPRCTILAESEL